MGHSWTIGKPGLPLGMATLLSTALFMGIAPTASAQTDALPFTPVQPTDFAVAGSLSNSWADFDRDGDLDLAVSFKSGTIRLYRNDDGKFTDVGPALGLPTSGSDIRGVGWGDYDGDGWPDLVAGPLAADKLTAVYRNEGGKHFTNVAPQIGLTVPGRSARQTSWVDIDNDGDLDLHAANRTGPNSLYRNDGGTFALIADKAIADPRPTVGACWLDYDRDGDLDLFLANQSGATDALLRNDGGAFVDVALQLGMDNPGRRKDEGGVGCAVGDYDNDGHLDLFVPNYGRNALYRANGDGTFTNVAAAVGLDVDNHAVGAAWGDYDNDGFIDLFVTSYTGEVGKQQPRDALFRNMGGKGFVNVLPTDSPLNVGDHGVQWVDYDRNGALDLSVMRGYTDQGGHFLFHNDLAPADTRRSLSVLVLDAEGRFTRMGAEVRLYDKGGKILATRQVSTGGGYNAQDAAPLHFGLTTLAPVTVEVTFMSAKGRKLQTIRNVNPTRFAGKALVIRETK